ncbi:MAG: phosphoglucomutase/phosphomannomutase family protein, partial [Elusimicrobia bacterium]|nr:phosphoglucomutase/phosphomannomutase family protein [Elusimicrobiota bacterium]
MAANSGDIKFGTDGWRGVMAWDFTFDNVRKVAQAIADYSRGKLGVAANDRTLVVGYDRRFLSRRFAAEIAGVLKANKLSVTLLDAPVPTQCISHLTMKKFWLGVMVTASHNPPTYNGIKIKWAGCSAPETLTAEIEALIARNSPLLSEEAESPRGKECRAQYVSYLKAACKRQLISSKLKAPVVVDYMNGCGAGIFDEALGYKKLFAISGGTDPLFGGRNPEPIERNLAQLMVEVKAKKAAAGFAFDGDADR